MKCNCEQSKGLIDGIKKAMPELENIHAPVEMLSGRIYLNFTATRVVRGKNKEIDVPILLSHCPFCGVKYLEAEND